MITTIKCRVSDSRFGDTVEWDADLLDGQSIEDARVIAARSLADGMAETFRVWAREARLALENPTDAPEEFEAAEIARMRSDLIDAVEIVA